MFSLLHQLITSLFSPYFHYLPLRQVFSTWWGKANCQHLQFTSPFIFPAKSKLRQSVHQFQGRTLIGSAKVTCSLTEPISDAWRIEPSDWSDLRHTPISLVSFVNIWNLMGRLVSALATSVKRAHLYPQDREHPVMKVRAWTFDASCQNQKSLLKVNSNFTFKNETMTETQMIATHLWLIPNRYRIIMLFTWRSHTPDANVSLQLSDFALPDLDVQVARKERLSINMTLPMYVILLGDNQ